MPYTDVAKKELCPIAYLIRNCLSFGLIVCSAKSLKVWRGGTNLSVLRFPRCLHLARHAWHIVAQIMHITNTEQCTPENTKGTMDTADVALHIQ